mmetsp:Transcript_15935/g.21069  ORF Transcript_15935/g.21069 Transcript_15935/m.21069 type:complete len:318 (-) Transcript_15935:42-995(-)|eukprot:CAMPEP_0117749582 /NCGR_PEP_ID=MMETSP0947-20121206/9817_1 /TAXON_ID=44440 /ORGANISM="Chattonella subsalsa, Strain CCMP2191" /LENGTH=317 /DNA_ID=CAMNT_0005567503 /DNA_START=76 /DNA_END=1032 /DNA_ORIENTATION=+
MISSADVEGECLLIPLIDEKHLHQEALLGNIEIFRKFIELISDLEAKDIRGRTLLQNAVIGGNKELVELLLEQGASPDNSDRNGYTCIHWASITGNSNVLSKVGTQTQNLNARDKDGATPLHQAAKRGNIEAVRTLLELGADTEVRDNKGLKPGDIFQRRVPEACQLCILELLYNVPKVERSLSPPSSCKSPFPALTTTVRSLSSTPVRNKTVSPVPFSSAQQKKKGKTSLFKSMDILSQGQVKAKQYTRKKTEYTLRHKKLSLRKKTFSFIAPQKDKSSSLYESVLQNEKDSSIEKCSNNSTPKSPASTYDSCALC